MLYLSCNVMKNISQKQFADGRGDIYLLIAFVQQT